MISYLFFYFFPEWMSMLLPNTPDKTGVAGPSNESSVRSVPFSIPDSLSTFLEEHGGTIRTSSLHSGEGSAWPTRDVRLFLFITN